MPSPSRKESHDACLEQLLYLSTWLAADSKTATLAQEIDELLEVLDGTQRRLVEARRGEVRARAARDHRDELAHDEVKKFSRRFRVAEGADFVTRRLFPFGIGYTATPRGRAQIDRLVQLRARTDELLMSERLAAHPEAAELRVTLEDGRATLGESIAGLGAAIDSWEAQVTKVAQAEAAFDRRRTEAAARLDGLLGELQILLGAGVVSLFDAIPSWRDAAFAEPAALESRVVASLDEVG